MKNAGRITVEAARRLLNVKPDADADALRAARNRAVMRAHPDHGGTEDALRDVLEAHKILEAMLGVDAANDEPAAPRGPRLEITPSIAMAGGRTVTRLADGRKVALNLPAGLRNGDRVSASGELLTVSVKGRPEVFVSGDDLCMTIKASPDLLRDGGRLKIRTPTGSCLVWIPKQTGSNRIVRVLGRGLPARGRHPQGALILKLVPDQPAKDTPAKAKRKRFGLAWAQA